MIHLQETDRGEPYSWRDPSDIRREMETLSGALAAAHERYAALEVARDLIRDYRQDDAASDAFGQLVESARDTLTHIDRYVERIAELQKEMKDTLCLMQRI